MRAIFTGLSLLILCGPSAARHAQEPTPAAPAAPAATATTAAPAGPAAARQATQATGEAKPASAFTPEQLEQLVAPIALHPDTLLSQILMASTYPLEIVEAARWLAKNPGLKADALDKALQSQTWDPSVKALCAVPDVIKQLDTNLDWTQDLGDAFLGQREDLMKTVQVMRKKAKESGNLESTKEQKVTEESADVIVIQQADPTVVYVPTYYPTVVYGSWGYPAYYYPPMYPPYPAGGVAFGFTVGVFWGAAWSNCNWGGNDVDIDINNQNNFIDRTENGNRRDQVKNKSREGGGKFNHDAAHRKGVSYRDSKSAKQYGGSAGSNRVSRDQARGYGDRSTQRPSAGTRDTSPSRDTASSRNTPSSRDSASKRDTGGGSRSSNGGSLGGSRNPSLDRAASSRGGSSRGSGGSRGGGGRGGGGRGGGRR